MIQPSSLDKGVIAQLDATPDNTESVKVSDCIKNAMATYFEQISDSSTSGLYQLVLSEVEKPLLESVMEHTKNNQSKAAQVLGISRSTLRKKLGQYQLDNG